jgi:hypothetical protein
MDIYAAWYAVFGAYRNPKTGVVEISRISREPKTWDDARENLAIFTKGMPNNATYFVGNFA